MTPDTIPSQAPVVLTIARDTAWLLGLLVVAGCWTVVVALLTLAAPILSKILDRAHVRVWR